MSFLYTVQSGDTLPQISQRYGIPLLNLAQANGIYYPYSIYTGQKLSVPANSLNYVSYPASETVYAFAEEYAVPYKRHTGLESVENVIGKKGSIADGVMKFTFPRYDLKVNIGPVLIEPELALTSWMAFGQAYNSSMVMGDIVLTESEIDPVISQVVTNGLEITALHNHLFGELPRVMYLHISGEGDAIRLAQSIKNVLAVTQTPLRSHTSSQTIPEEYWSSVENIMGKKGNHVGRVLQFSFPRADVIKENGMIIPPSMGISQAVNFQAEGQNAAVTGDFVLTAEEVNPVVRALKEYGVAVTALHNHMLYESPRLFFMHFWAVNNAERLAYGLKQVLMQTNTVISRQ